MSRERVGGVVGIGSGGGSGERRRVLMMKEICSANNC